MSKDVFRTNNGEQIVGLGGMLLPGKLIGENGTTGEITIKVINENLISLPGGNYPKLLPPVTVANFLTNEFGIAKGIRETGLIFVDKSYNLNVDDFTFYLNFTYGAAGGYQLNVYIAFEKETKGIPEEYNTFGFEVNFEGDTITCDGGNAIALSEIKTIETFVLDVDPETSRGTVTTVQPSSE